MAYRIEYGPAIPEKYRKQQPGPHRIQLLTAVCLLVFTMIVKIWFPAGTHKLQQFLLPGTPSVTQQALDELVIRVRFGDPLDEAFTAFCRHIIESDPAISN